LKFLAYIDPGAGSFALQAAIGAVMGFSYVVRNHVRSFLGRFKKDSKIVKPDDAG